MKNKYLISTAIAATTIVPLLGASGLVSAVGEEYIVFSGDGGSSTTCYIYDSAGSASCDPTFGSYNASTHTLTLGEGVNGDLSVVSTRLSGALTIASNSDINLKSLSTNDAITDIVLEFGENSFTGKFLAGSSITINNGSYYINNGDDWLYADDFTLNDGFINVGRILVAQNALINGGELEMVGQYGLISNGGIEINGGHVSFQGSTNGLRNNSTKSSISINGGVIDLSADSSSIGSGSGIISTGDVNINGGNITIDGFGSGLSIGGNAGFHFNGGTTIIKNSSHSVYVYNTTTPEGSIIFGDNMGIKEDGVQIVYDTSTASISADLVTIAKIKEDEEESTSDPDDTEKEDTEEDEDIAIPNTAGSAKTPDTGAFSDTLKNATLIAISLSSLVTISIVVYLATYIFNRRSNKVKFSRNDRLDD